MSGGLLLNVFALFEPGDSSKFLEKLKLLILAKCDCFSGVKGSLGSSSGRSNTFIVVIKQHLVGKLKLNNFLFAPC